MRIGVAYDLRSDFIVADTDPDDRLEEYDSEETVYAIADVISRAGHEAIRLGGARRFLETLLQKPVPVDLVFNIAEGAPESLGREAQVPAVCEMLHVSYTHSDPVTLALALDKAYTQRLLGSYGVPVATSCVISCIQELDTAALPPFPVLVKPRAEGSSKGIRLDCRCETRRALVDRVSSLLDRYRQPILIETFLSGTETTVAVMGTGSDARVVGTMEIAPRGTSASTFLYALETKREYHTKVDYHLPPRLPPAMIAAIEQTALQAYRVLGCRDVGRVDLRNDAAGLAHVLDVNPLPGLHPVHSDLPILCGMVGISYGTLITDIIASALRRQSGRTVA